MEVLTTVLARKRSKCYKLLVFCEANFVQVFGRCPRRQCICATRRSQEHYEWNDDAFLSTHTWPSCFASHIQASD